MSIRRREFHLSLKYTSAIMASATTNSVPVITFLFAVLLELKTMRFRTLSSTAKAAGVALCLAGVLVIALYTGPPISPLNKHRAFAGQTTMAGNKKATWMKGTFLMLLANVTWSLFIVLQARLLKEYPNKLLATALQCLLSTVQSFGLAAVAERDLAGWKLRMDVGLVAVAYSGFLVTGVSFYLQAWCIEKRGPVFLAMSNPLGLVLTIFCSSFFLGEVVHLGSILGGVLLVAGLYSVLWGKSKEQAPPTAPSIKQGCVNSLDDDRNNDEEEMKEGKKLEASPMDQV